MNPELIAALAAGHRRDLTARAAAPRVPMSRPRLRAAGRYLPRYRVTWTRVALALTEDGRPGSSWAIVISGGRAH